MPTVEDRGRAEPPLRPAVLGALASHALAAAAMAAPWPVLLLGVWDATGGGSWLGFVGAARLAPYVALSWLAGRLADRAHRGRLVVLSTVGRTLFLTLAAVALAGGSLVLAVACSTLAVAIGTPAFPAIAAALPETEGAAAARATAALVTIEVSAFVVGPAFAGALLGLVPGWVVIAGAATASAAAIPLVRPWSRGPGVAPAWPAGTADAIGLRLLAATPAALTAILVVAVVNLVDNLVAVSLLPLAESDWERGAGSFGLATAVLGFGALLAPILYRLLGAGLTAISLLTLATPLLLVSVSGGPVTALPALALVGAASVQIETVTTTTIQDSVPPSQAAGILGLTDSVMVAASIVGAVSAPLLTGLAGARAAVALAGLTVGALAVARAWRPPRARAAAETA